MDMSVNSVGSSSLLNFSLKTKSTTSSNSSSKDAGLEKATDDVSSSAASKSASSVASTSADAAGVASENAKKSDAKLEKIKEELKKSVILPSTQKIVAKYGITTEQAQKILFDICLERASATGVSAEKAAEAATGMYLMAEMSDNEVTDLIDIDLAKSLATQKESKSAEEETSSAQEISSKYDLTLEEAQAVLAEVEKNKESSSSNSSSNSIDNKDASGSTSNTVANNNPSNIATYSVNVKGVLSTSPIAFSNSDFLGMSTVSYSV